MVPALLLDAPGHLVYWTVLIWSELCSIVLQISAIHLPLLLDEEQVQNVPIKITEGDAFWLLVISLYVSLANEELQS